MGGVAGIEYHGPSFESLGRLSDKRRFFIFFRKNQNGFSLGGILGANSPRGQIWLRREFLIFHIFGAGGSIVLIARTPSIFFPLGINSF